jgi:non-specific serine/threonine protein kinase
VAAAAWAGGVIVIGGYRADGSSSPRADLWRPGEDRWRRLPDLPSGRNHPAAAVLDERLYVSGGRGDDAPRGATQVWSLGSAERSWRPEPPLRHARLAHAMTEVDGQLVVAGGTGPAGLLTSVEILTAGSWRPGPPLRAGREHLGGVTSAGRFWVVAGRRGGLATNLATVESWAPGERAWRREPDLRTPRGGVGAGERAGEVCVAGGEQPAGTIHTVECLRGGRWQTVASLAVPRHGLAVVGLSDGLHVIAGGPRPGLTVSGVHELL